MIAAALLGTIIPIFAEPQRDTKPKANGQKQVQARYVTTGYIRMTSPETLGRVLKLGGPAGKLVRKAEGERLQTRTVRMDTPVDLKNFRMPAPGKRDDRKKDETLTYIPMTYTGFLGVFSKQESSFDAAYGDVSQTTQAPNGHYDGVATSNGTVKVSKVKGGPFSVVSASTYTGYWNNGAPEVEKTVLAQNGELSIPVKAGQEYKVLYKFDSSKLAIGSYKGTSDIDDGSIIHMNLSGNIVPAYGGIKASIGSYSSVLGTGQHMDIPITFAVDGNTPTTQVKMEILNESELKAAGILSKGDSVSVKNGGQNTGKVTISGLPSAADSQQIIKVKFSGYAGNASATLNIPITVKTLWVDSDGVNVTAGDVSLWVRLKFNSMGYYECTANATTSAKVLGDEVSWFICANNQVKGMRPGMYDMVRLNAKLESGPSSKDFGTSGYSSFIGDGFNSLLGTGFTAKMYVNMDLSSFQEGMKAMNFVKPWGTKD